MELIFHFSPLNFVLYPEHFERGRFFGWFFSRLQGFVREERGTNDKMNGSRYKVQCWCVCLRARTCACRWLEEQAASGSVRKHLVSAGEEEEMVGKKERRDGGRRRRGQSWRGGRCCRPGGFTASTTSSLPTPPSLLQPVTAPPSLHLLLLRKRHFVKRTNTSCFASFLPATHPTAFI